MPASKAELTTDKQILYLVQWFAEFSDFQRGDFLADHLLPIFGPFLKEKILDPAEGELNGNGEALLNGLGSLDISDPACPPSIFKCRMKLFTEWYTSWTESDRVEFLLRLRNIDSAFLSEFYRLFLHQNGISTNEELQLSLKPDQAELLTRLDINEKVFESKVPEVLARTPLGPLNGQTATETPDLLNDVVGIACTSSGANSIEPEPAVIPAEAQEPEVQVDVPTEEVEAVEEVKSEEPEETQEEEMIEEPSIGDIEVIDIVTVDEPAPIVTSTIAPPDVVA